MKVFWIKLTTIITSIAPICIYLGLNYNQYFAMRVNERMGVGVFISALVLLIALKDNLAGILKNNAQLKVSAFLLFLFWGMEKVSNQIIILSFLSLVGAVISLPFSMWSTKLQRDKTMQKQAEINAKAMTSAGVVITKK